MFGKIKEIFKSKKLITLILCLFLAVGSTVIFTNNKATNNSTLVVENISTKSEPQLLEGEGFSVTYNPTAELQTYNGLNNMAVRTSTEQPTWNKWESANTENWQYRWGTNSQVTMSGGTEIKYETSVRNGIYDFDNNKYNQFIDENNDNTYTEGTDTLICNTLTLTFTTGTSEYTQTCTSNYGYKITKLYYKVGTGDWIELTGTKTTEDIVENYEEGVTITFKPDGEKIQYETQFAYQDDNGGYELSNEVGYDVEGCDTLPSNISSTTRYVKAWLYNNNEITGSSTTISSTNYSVTINFTGETINDYPVVKSIEGWGNLPTYDSNNNPYIIGYMGYIYSIEFLGADNATSGLTVTAADTQPEHYNIVTDETKGYAFHKLSDFEGGYYGLGSDFKYYALKYGYYISYWQASLSYKIKDDNQLYIINSTNLTQNGFDALAGKGLTNLVDVAEDLDKRLGGKLISTTPLTLYLNPTWQAAKIDIGARVDNGVYYDKGYKFDEVLEQTGQTEMFAYTTNESETGEYEPEGKTTKHNIIALEGVFNYKNLNHSQFKYENGIYKLNIESVYVDNIYRANININESNNTVSSDLFPNDIYPIGFTSEHYGYSEDNTTPKSASTNETIRYFDTDILDHYGYKSWNEWKSTNSKIEYYTAQMLGWKDTYISKINGDEDTEDFNILKNIYITDPEDKVSAQPKDANNFVKINSIYSASSIFFFIANNQIVRSLPSWENATSFVAYYTFIDKFDNGSYVSETPSDDANYVADRYREAYPEDSEASPEPVETWEKTDSTTEIFNVNYFRKYFLLNVETLLDSTHGKYGYVELAIIDEINTYEGIGNETATYRVYFDSLDANKNAKYIIEKKNQENNWSRYESGAEGEELIEFNEIRLYSGCSLTVKVYDQSNIDLNELKGDFSSAVGYTFNNTKSADDLQVFRFVKDEDEATYVQTGDDLITTDEYESTLTSEINNYAQGDRIKITVKYSKVNYNFTIKATAGHFANLGGNGSVATANKTLYVNDDLSIKPLQFNWGYGFTTNAFTLTNSKRSDFDITSKMGEMNSTWLLTTYYAESRPSNALTQNATINVNSAKYEFNISSEYINNSNIVLRESYGSKVKVGETLDYAFMVWYDENIGLYFEHEGVKYAITSYGLKQQDGGTALLEGNPDCDFLYKSGEFSEKITSNLLGEMFNGDTDLYDDNNIINLANRNIVVVFNLEKLLTVNVQVETNGMNEGWNNVVVTSDRLTSTFLPTTSPVHYSYVGLENTITANYNQAFFEGATYWYYTGEKQDTIPTSLTELPVDANGKFILKDTTTQYNIVVKLEPAVLTVNVSYKMANRYSDSYASLGNANIVGNWIYKSGAEIADANKIVKITYEPSELSLNDTISWEYEFGALQEWYDIEVVKVLRKDGTTNYIKIDNPYTVTVDDFTGSGEFDIWFVLRPWPTDDLTIRFVADSSYKFDASVVFANSTLKSNGVEIPSINLNGKTLSIDFTCANGFEYAGKYVYDNVIHTTALNPTNGVYSINLGVFNKPDTNSKGKICTIYVKPVTVFVNVEYSATQHNDSYLVANTYDITKGKNEIVTAVYQDVYLLNDETKHQDEVFNYFYYMNGTEEVKLVDANGAPLKAFEITSDMLNNAVAGTYTDSGVTKSCYTFKLKVNTTEKYALNYATSSNFESNETLTVELKDSEETELNGKYYFVGDEFAFTLTMQAEDAGKYKLYTVINGVEEDVTSAIVDNKFEFAYTMQAEDADITFKIVANELAINIQEFDYIKLSEMQNPGTAKQTSSAINGVSVTKGDYKNSITLSAIYSNSSKILRKVYISGNDFGSNYVIAYNNNSWKLGTYTQDGDVITETYDGINLPDDLIEFKEENGRFVLTYVAKNAITIRYDYADYKTIS